MNKVVIVTIVVLLLWNTFLSYELFSRKEDNKVVQTYVENTINGYTSDITKTIENCETKIVSVDTIVDEEIDSHGSGIVWDNQQDGIVIVTNYHIVKDCDKVMVTFANDISLEASIVGKDEVSDVAVLKLQTDFQTSSILKGDSNEVTKGEYVVALGSPVNKIFNGSATFGIVSNDIIIVPKDSDNDGLYDYNEVLIQTDANMSVGNSGGALVNLNGDLLGLNSKGIKDNNAQGMNFAISVNELKLIVNEILKEGQVTRGYLGVLGKNVSDLETYEKSYLNVNLELSRGYLVTYVLNSSTAGSSGLMNNDIIYAIDNTPIKGFDSLQQVLYQKEKGEQVEVKVIRNGIEESVMVELG